MLPFWSRISQFWPLWRVQRRFAPFHLPFAPSPTDIREWNLELQPPVVLAENTFPNNARISISLHRILIEAGIASTLATTSWDPRSWHALYRYGGDFAGTAPKLRFYTGVEQKDPRLTAVTSEEVAAGITCYLLREHLNLPHIADVYACIQKGELRYVDPVARERPDYFCQGNDGLSLLAESKGSTGTRSSIARRIDPEGWHQVQNVVPVNLPLRNPCGRIVIGTHFCVEGKHLQSETTTIIKDPDGETREAANPDSDMTLRLAYAKCLRFMGQDVIAERLIARMTFAEFENLADVRLPHIGSLPIFPLGTTAFGDLIGLFGPTAKALFGNRPEDVQRLVVESLASFAEVRNGVGTEGYTFANGVVVVHDAMRVTEEMI